jgi:hypothetical protein
MSSLLVFSSVLTESMLVRRRPNPQCYLWSIKSSVGLLNDRSKRHNRAGSQHCNAGVGHSDAVNVNSLRPQGTVVNYYAFDPHRPCLANWY